MIVSLVRIQALARLVIVDGLRRHALLGLVVMALGVEVSGLFFFAFVPRDIGLVSSDFVVSIGWCAGMVYLLFHAVGVMSWGEDRRVIHTLLARPVSRTEYVLGVFCGLFALLLLLNLFLGTIGYGVLWLIKSWVGESYFGQLNPGGYLLSWWGVISIETMVLSAVVLFSGLIRGNFTVLLVTLSYYFISNGIPVALETLRGGSPVVRRLLHGLTLIFPNMSMFDYKDLIAALGHRPATSTLAFNLVYVLVYNALVLVLAASVYGRRDLK
jgi:ABC-type transport system involved in multi-copper enzyme maturation permease subunit